LLSRYQTLKFRRLRDLLDETDGSLGAHLRKLEDEGLVLVRKEFEDRKPVSWYALTAKGKKALQAHVRGLQSLLKQARN
jgi:DNA-binding PadR family transcriptional regulator